MKRIGIAAVILLAACEPAQKPDAERASLVPAPGPGNVFELSGDGRLAYSYFIKGKSAIFVASVDGTNPKRVSFGLWDFAPLWSPDKKWIALRRDMGGHSDVSIVPADSGAERVVAATSTDELPAGWLGDGSVFLYAQRTTHGYELWTYRMSDSTRERLFESDGSVGGTPARKANLVAYIQSKGGKNTLWLWNGDKKTHQQLTTDGLESLTEHAFSPDDASLLYVTRRTGTSDIWRVDLATGNKTQITQDVADDFSPEWSPDGQRIAFLSNRGGQPDLWVTSAGESDAQRITNDALSEGRARWSSDGTSLLSVVGSGHQHLYAMPVDGTPARALTSGDWDVLDAVRSDDRTMIAFVSTKNGDPDIWLMPATGGEPRLLAGGPGDDDEPHWSHDGKQIAFVSPRSGNDDIWIVPVEGGAPRKLTDWPTFERDPQWSVDGKSITFVSGRESSGDDLWTVPVEGGTPKRLTNMGTFGTHVWSNDGKWIAFGAQTRTSGGLALFAISPTGGEPKQIAPATILNVSWSANSKEIAVAQCLRSGSCRIEIRSPEGKFLRALNTSPDMLYEFGARWSTDDSHIASAFQDLAGGGEVFVEIRSAQTGALVRRLPNPAGFSMAPIGYAAGGATVIAGGQPRNTPLVRLPVPPVSR